MSWPGSCARPNCRSAVAEAVPPPRGGLGTVLLLWLAAVVVVAAAYLLPEGAPTLLEVLLQLVGVMLFGGGLGALVRRGRSEQP